MKKILFIVLVLVLNAYADYYPSVHQTSVDGRIGVVDQMKYIASINGKYPYGFNRSFVLTHHAKDDNAGNFCVDGWSQMKIYIPAGTTYLQLSLSTKTNTNYIAHIKYRSQINKVDHISTIGNNLDNIITEKTVSWPINDVGQIVLYEDDVKKLTGTTGGWLYIDVAGDTYHRVSSFFNNYNATITLSYYIKISDQSAFNNWLKTTYFKSDGDPIDESSTMTIVNNSCSNGYQSTLMSLNQNGALYDGSTVYEPEPVKTPQEQCSDAGNKWISSSSSCVTPEVYACIVDNSGTWSSYESRCISPEETACDAVNTTKWIVSSETCVDKEKVVNAQLEDGYWVIPLFYANSEGWKTDLSIKNLNTNSALVKTTTVKVLDTTQQTTGLTRIEGLNASEIWNATLYEESGKVYLEDNTTSSTKSQLNPKLTTGVIKVIPGNGEDASELQVDATIKYEPTTVTPPPEDDISAEQAACEAANNTWSSEINQCLYTNTDSNTNTNTTPPPSNAALKAECEARGTYFSWNASAAVCLYTPPTQSNTPVVTTPSTDSAKKAACEAQGTEYHWNSEVALCMYTPEAKSSTEGLDLSDEVSDDDIRKELSDQVAAKTFPVSGYFVHFASGSYDWAYINASGSLVAKLTGIDSNGNLTWEILRYAKQGIELLTGAAFNDDYTQVSFGSELSVPGRSSSTANILADKTYSITGLFVHYGVGSYDWVYLNKTGAVAAKLTGLDASTGKLTWVWLEGNGEDLFSNIDMGDKREITFGNAN